MSSWLVLRLIQIQLEQTGALISRPRHFNRRQEPIIILSDTLNTQSSCNISEVNRSSASAWLST